MIRLQNVSKYYYSKGMISTGISKVNLNLELGEFVVITGESGSGKSTLLNVISGLDSYEEGEMYIDGEETSHFLASDFERYRKKYIANIFQTFNLVNSYTVYQNVELILLINGYKRKEVKNRVDSIISKVGLSEFRNTKVSKLSGGQQQRVAIARALAKETDIIVADEPTANLDSKSSEEIIRLLSDISKDKLVVVVTHNYSQFEQYATRRVKMHDGKVMEDVVLRQSFSNGVHSVHKNKKMSIANQVRIGFRNTFNILYKFALLMVVFLFLAFSVTTLYSSYHKMQTESDAVGNVNEVFMNASKDRIIITKSDKSEFTSDDIKRLKSVSHVVDVAPNDILLDKEVSVLLDNDEVFGYPGATSELNGETVDVGDMPQKDNEVVLKVDDVDMFSEYIGKSGDFTIDYNPIGETAKIVGVIGGQKDETVSIYISDSMMDSVRSNIYSSGSGVKLTMNNIEWNNSEGEEYEGEFSSEESFIKLSPNVKRGEMIVPAGFEENFLMDATPMDEETEEYVDRAAVGNNISMSVSNMFYNDSKTFKITDVYYDKKSYDKLIGDGKYIEGETKVYINQEDYKSLFEKGNYQCSVYVDDESNVNSANDELKLMGYNTLPLDSTMVSMDDLYSDGFGNMFSMLLPIIILVVAVIFAVSYIVISLILRSRNTYFSILRILGMHKRSITNILDVEILLIANIAFATLIVVSKYAPIDRIHELTEGVRNADYILLYAMIIVIAFLISHLFSRKLFKNTAIGTFREEA